MKNRPESGLCHSITLTTSISSRAFLRSTFIGYLVTPESSSGRIASHIVQSSSISCSGGSLFCVDQHTAKNYHDPELTWNSKYAPQCSWRGHDEHDGSRGLQTVDPSSMSAWFMSPGLSDFLTIAVAPSHNMSSAAFDFGFACTLKTRLSRRLTLPSSYFLNDQMSAK